MHTPAPVLFLVMCSLWTPAAMAGEREPEALTHFLWQAPLDARGTLAVKVTFTHSEPGPCDLEFRTATEHRPVNPVSHYVLGTRGSASGGSHHLVQAHGGPIDTRTIDLNEGGFGWSVTKMWGTMSGTQTVLFAGFGLRAWDYPAVAHLFSIELTCALPFAVTDLMKGTEGFAFDSNSLADGAGVSEAWAGQVAAGVGDGARFATAMPAVEFHAHRWLAQGAMVGNLTVAGPAESSRWDLASLASGLDVTRFDAYGGAGSYEIGLTQASAASLALLYGVFLGLEPVAAL